MNNLPRFLEIDISSFAKELEDLLAKNLNEINQLLKKEQFFNWENLIHPLEELDNNLQLFWAPLSHLHAVMDSPPLRECYEICLAKLSAYEASIGQNHQLYDAIKSLNRHELNDSQNKIINDMLQDFELSGVALSAKHKQRFEEIQIKLSELSSQFENNILDSVQAYELLINDENRLDGIPLHTLQYAKELAEEKGKDGWLFRLDFPCFQAVIMYAKDRDLRKTIYCAYITRASDQGPLAGQFDNSKIMQEILALRHEQAHLLGFLNYAALSLATKMAESTDHVLGFLNDLTKRAYPQAKKEFKSLQKFAKRFYNLEEIQPWDIAFLSEQQRQKEFAISQEQIRAYFPLKKVMSGLMIILKRLFGIQFKIVQGVEVWHPDVVCYEILDKNKKIRGYIYMDLFSRPHKRGGAWMDSLQARYLKINGEIQLPIATLTCNFTPAALNSEPTLLHDEVLTLFHEFGHCLHHVLTKVDYLSASGIQGVEWDAVELPSQFLENWCWEKSALKLLTSHVVDGKIMPDDLFDRLLSVKNFQSAMWMLRQLEFSLFDFRIHIKYDHNNPDFIAEVLQKVRKKTSVVPIISSNRFQHSFSHIFAGGYAAGYYSYKWAEVLSSDAFNRFEEEGIFNAKTGRDFLKTILEVGGSRKASEAYKNFRGKEATIDALLRHSGILG